MLLTADLSAMTILESLLEFGAMAILVTILFWYSKVKFTEDKEEKKELREELKSVREDFEKFKESHIEKLYEVNDKYIDLLKANQELLQKIFEGLPECKDK